MSRDYSKVVLDRKVYYDPRSLNYRIAALASELSVPSEPVSRRWRTPIVLDQGQEGACVGFAWTGWAGSMSKPWKPTLRNLDAFALYHRAQSLDEWPGEGYEGSSTLGGARASDELGRVSSYHWATTIEEILLAVGHIGPVVVGINWYDGMYEPHDDELKVEGALAGGHDILINAVDVKKERLRFHNSWGHGWGVNGEAWMSFADVERLVITEKGDCCLPVKKPQS